MTDNRPLRDEDLVALLGQLKHTDSEYPPGLQSKRREAFLAMIAVPTFIPGDVSAPAQQAAQVGHAANAAHAAEAAMSVGMKVTLGVLSTVVVGLSAYVGGMVYDRRDAIADWLAGRTPTAVWEAPSPSDTSAASTPEPSLTPLVPTESVTPTFEVSETPVPAGNPVTTVQPPVSPTETHPGLHLGQTKTPRPKKTPENKQ